MSQTWSYTSSHISVPMPCPRHGLTLTHLIADACPRHLLHCLTSRARYMSQTCLTLALVLIPMHVPDMSYTGSHNVADACLRHVLH
ncbi:Phosphopantetheine adenylyltransferase [Gossypium arboreum]|uniref:Phosphopantetheine adenylyltransferase n=1 Tax=Gossypium arboreum TaxID=29729 RepID=A0A0B0ND83_GOSAR|nr:Phosphopantetheine adenylyltransferase [Gossypium arboreum]